MSCKFKSTKNLGQGKREIHSQTVPVTRVALFSGVPERLLSRVIALAGALSCGGSTLGVVSVFYHEDVISSVLPGIQRDCKENGLK
jgi:hypothetical protein